MKKDWLLFITAILISAIGLTTLYSTEIGEESFISGGTLNRQVIALVLALILYFVASRINYQYLGHLQIFIPLVVGMVVALILMLLFAPEINNAKRWIMLGGFRLQPSEFAKIVVIISTAGILALKDRYNVWILAAISALPVGIVCLLIFVSPDASTALLTFLVWGVIVFTLLPHQLRNFVFIVITILLAVLINMRFTLTLPYILLLLAPVVLCLVWLFFIKQGPKVVIVVSLIAGMILGIGFNFTWKNVLSDQQKNRIEAFRNPQEHSQDIAFQVRQSEIAIGSGMIFGKGFGHGKQTKLKFLPEHQTDFIFASYAEEFGLVGALLLLTLYGFLIFRTIHIATLSTDIFGSLICIGIATKIMLEVFINIGMNLGVIPATGIPLPLMSKGGSIILATMLCLGLVQSVFANRDLLDRS